MIGQGEAELPVENVQEERPLDLLLRREEEEEVSHWRKRVRKINEDEEKVKEKRKRHESPHALESHFCTRQMALVE